MQDAGRMGNTLAQRVVTVETWNVWGKAPEGRQYLDMQRDQRGCTGQDRSDPTLIIQLFPVGAMTVRR